VEPDSLDFGTVEVGTNSTLTIQISNTGESALTGTIATPEGYAVGDAIRTRQSGQRVEERNTLEFSVAANSSASYAVTFNPTAVQDYTAYLTITSNDPLQPSFTIPLAGTGTPVSLSAPQGLTVSVSGGNVTLSWAAVTHATGYKVYSSNDPYTGFSEDSAGSFNGTSWTAPIEDIRLFYRVTAVRETAVRPATSQPTKDNHNQASQSE
jgi:hypothetical protein